MPRPRLLSALIACAILALLIVPAPVGAASTLTVTTGDDLVDGSGCTLAHCSLREAITAANATADADTIAFALPGSPPVLVKPTSPLPDVGSSVTLDGTTQPGYAGTPSVRIDGALAGTGDGLRLAGTGSSLVGLAVTRFAGVGVRVLGSGNSVRSSTIGTDGAGGTGLGNTLTGVLVSGANNTVGGAAVGNVIAANGETGVRVGGTTATGNRIEANVIRNNSGDGAMVRAAATARLTQNSVFDNGLLGIDLYPAGVTPNDGGDTDTGPNGYQNFPALTSAVSSGTSTLVQGTLGSKASTSYTVEVFANPSCDPSGSGEGRTYVGSATAATNAAGTGAFSLSLSASSAPVGSFLTATATSPGGETSEFSACRLVQADDEPPPPPRDGYNFVIVLTDDQSLDTVPHTPPVMPYLQGRLQDPSDHWIQFPNTYTNVAMCCPARAALLTGRYAHHNHVESNIHGQRLDERDTLATWLDGAGYRTGLVGKYLNEYPWDRGHYVPPGWDWWMGWEGPPNVPYYNYTLNENGVPRTYGSTAADYSTDVYKAKALQFLDGVEAEEPFLLYFAPGSPHLPRTPAPRHKGLWKTAEPVRWPSFNEADVSDKPAWVRNRPQYSSTKITAFDRQRREQYRALASVDEAIQALVDKLTAIGELDETIIVFLSDNGVAWGEHRWESKLCPYRSCSQVPLFARVPWAAARTDTRVLSNVDVAPTIADLAGVTPASPVDGQSFAALLDGSSATWAGEALLQWMGPQAIPAYWGLRTVDYTYLEYPATGEIELYDLTGRFGPADPDEIQNVCPGNRAPCPAPYEAVRAQLAARLTALRSG